MTFEMLVMVSLAGALGLFSFLRLIKLEFEVAKLNRLVEYLMVRGHDDRP